MKKLAFLLILTPLVFNPAFAGSDHGDCKHGKKDGKHRYMERMTDELDLTPEQSEKVRTIMQEKHQQMRALWQEQREQLKPQMQDIHSQSHEKLAAVLNDEQMQKLGQKRAEMKERHKKGREKRGDHDETR